MTKNILLVDTDKENLKENAAYLKESGFEVKTANSAKEALDLIDVKKPDLVVTEVMLEHVDSGFSLCFNIKKKFPEMPVFILSDVVKKSGLNFNLKTHEQSNWIKADKFFDKPINPASLACYISKQLA
jgi:DNA-binding response OmpR family regulator